MFVFEYRLADYWIIHLADGFFGCSIQFKLEAIQVVGRFHYCIGSSFGAPHFGFAELPHEFEHEVEDYLVVAFRLVVKLVRNVGKEGAQTIHKGIHITGT